MSLQNAIHVKDGKVYGAGLPDEYPASNVTLSGGECRGCISWKKSDSY